MPIRQPTDDPTALTMKEAIVREALMRISGVRVGIVEGYDAVQRTADVQPVRRRRVFGKPVDQIKVIGAPVGWWRFGRMVLAGELEAGDEVLLITTQREHRPWWLTGAVVDPQSERMHDRTDTMVLPWISSLVRPITARLPRTFFMGREDATAGVTIPMDVPARIEVEGGPAGIVLGSTAASPVVLYTPFLAAFSTYTGAVATAYTTWLNATGGGAAPTTIANGAFIFALGAANGVLATALAGLGSIKVVAE